MLLLIAVAIGAGIGVMYRMASVLSIDDAYNSAIFKGHAMRVTGVPEEKLKMATAVIDADLKNFRRKGVDRFTFSLESRESGGSFARRAPSGREGTWLCYHGFKLFVKTAFLNGATTVRTAGPHGKGVTYRSLEEFEKDLRAIADREVGEDVTYIELCGHVGI